MTVDWTAYAREYDLLMDNNPPYQELVRDCREAVRTWSLAPGSTLADLGGGTGNFSIPLALDYPEVRVVHVERDFGMLRVAKEKAARAAVQNWSLVESDIDAALTNLPDLDGVVTINVLYTLEHPLVSISHIAEKLRFGAYWYACDLGRRMRVWDWGRYLLIRALPKHGIRGTIRLLKMTQAVREQNRRIADLQRTGRFWTHTLAEFEAAFRHAGLEVLHASDRLYREYNDLIIARRTV